MTKDQNEKLENLINASHNVGYETAANALSRFGPVDRAELINRREHTYKLFLESLEPKEHPGDIVLVLVKIPGLSQWLIAKNQCTRFDAEQYVEKVGPEYPDGTFKLVTIQEFEK